MKRHFEKTAALILAAVLAVSLAACGSKEPAEEAAAGLANPLVESDEAGVIEATGLDLPTPEGAEEIQYLYIETEPKTAELRFTLDGRQYCLRAQETAETSIGVSQDMDADPLALMDADFTKLDISGLYYEWETVSLQDVQGRDAVCFVNSKEGAGHILWLDVVPGVLYDLGMTEHADEESLIETANTVFVPLQGEAG